MTLWTFPDADADADADADGSDPSPWPCAQVCLVVNPHVEWTIFNLVINTFFVCDMILQYASPHPQP